jgi:N-acetylglucosamine-6-phosphate deacetylase
LPVELTDLSAHRIAIGGRGKSVLTMDEAINNVMRHAALSLEAALQMAGRNREKLFPEVEKDIRPGSPGETVLFE